jgi:HSP20 family protein
MTNLVPRDSIFQDLFDFRRDFDQIFNRFLSWPSAHGERTLITGFTPAIESFIDKDDKKLHCQVMLPGVDPKDVNLQVQGNTLTISGERREVRENKEADFHHREITYGSFQRSILLPEGVEKDRLSAEYRNGMLEITAPIASAALPKKIEIKSLPLTRHVSA